MSVSMMMGAKRQGECTTAITGNGSRKFGIGRRRRRMMMRVLRAAPEGGGEGDNKSDAREWIDNWREKNDSGEEKKSCPKPVSDGAQVKTDASSSPLPPVSAMTSSPDAIAAKEQQILGKEAAQPEPEEGSRRDLLKYAGAGAGTLLLYFATRPKKPVKKRRRYKSEIEAENKKKGRGGRYGNRSATSVRLQSHNALSVFSRRIALMLGSRYNTNAILVRRSVDPI